MPGSAEDHSNAFESFTLPFRHLHRNAEPSLDGRVSPWHPERMQRTALVSAALRHIRDAQHLAEPAPHRSLEQALHLAGFGPECIRKACLDERLFDKSLGHEIRDQTDAVIAFLVAYDPDAHRYGVEDDAAELPFRTRYWRTDIRYVGAGYVAQMHRDGERELSALLEEARAFVDQRVCELFCDGAIDGEALS